MHEGAFLYNRIKYAIPANGLSEYGAGSRESPVEPILVESVLGPKPTPDSILTTLSGRYEIRIGMIGDDWLLDSKFDGAFIVDRDLRTIRVHSESNPPSAVCCDILTRRVLPRLMAARGAVTLHAASVATEGAGLVLLGASGAGKSTISAALAAMPGWSVLGDDLSPIWPGKPATVAPSGTGVCIWEASMRGLRLDPEACVPMAAYDGKYRYDPPAAPLVDAVPVRAFVFLSRKAGLEAPVVNRISRLQGIALAAQQIQLFDPTSSEAYAAAVTRLVTVASGVQMFSLAYPARYDALPAVANVLAGIARA